MSDFFKRISNQLTNLWEKYSTKQKIQIGATLAVAVVALVVLIMFLNRTEYVLLEKGIDLAKVNQIRTTLDEANIRYQIGEDTTSVYVEQTRKKDATLALAEAGIITSGDMEYKDLFNNSIMTSNSEQALKSKLFFEAELAKGIERLESIEEATVKIVIPDLDRSILKQASEAKASVIIKTRGEMSAGLAENIAKNLASAVENLDIKNVTIIDTNARLLFDGSSKNGELGGISGADYETRQELVVTNRVRSVLLAAGEYDDAMVAVDLVIDFDKLEKVSEIKSTQDGTSTGIIEKEEVHTAESTNTTEGGVPGTDSNGATDTMIQDSGNFSSTSEDRIIDYVYNTEVTTSAKAIGSVKYNESTVTVSLTKYKDYDEKILKRQADGPLVDKTWEEYKYEIKQQGRLKIAEVDPDIVSLVKNASNVENVQVIAYEVPRFIDQEVAPSSITDYILIGVVVIMILILGFAVYRGTEPVELAEIEPELSVEDMLVSTAEQTTVENIEFEGKSEARKQIEQFVDNNPDAVALLLRNWLNEEWE